MHMSGQHCWHHLASHQQCLRRRLPERIRRVAATQKASGGFHGFAYSTEGGHFGQLCTNVAVFPHPRAATSGAALHAAERSDPFVLPKRAKSRAAQFVLEDNRGAS